MLDKVSSRVTQRCPREVLRRDDREGTIGVRCAWPLIVVRESYQTTKFELFQDHTRDKVRRRFTLSVTACFDGTTGQAATGSGNGGGPCCCSLSVVLTSRATIMVVREIIIKMTKASVDDLSGLLAYTRCLHVGIRVWAPLHRSLVQ